MPKKGGRGKPPSQQMYKSMNFGAVTGNPGIQTSTKDYTSMLFAGNQG